MCRSCCSLSLGRLVDLFVRVCERRWANFAHRAGQPSPASFSLIAKGEARNSYLGLRDPLAADPASLLAGRGLPSDRAAFHWEEYPFARSALRRRNGGWPSSRTELERRALPLHDRQRRDSARTAIPAGRRGVTDDLAHSGRGRGWARTFGLKSAVITIRPGREQFNVVLVPIARRQRPRRAGRVGSAGRRGLHRYARRDCSAVKEEERCSAAARRFGCMAFRSGCSAMKKKICMVGAVRRRKNQPGAPLRRQHFR